MSPRSPRRRHRGAPFAVAILLCAPLLGGATCSKRPDPVAREQGAIHYDLGIQAMQNGDTRMALGELQRAIEFDPNLDVAHHALGLVLHLSFGKTDQAIEHYEKAIQLNPKMTEAYTNLANVYLSLNRCDEAIPLYEKALADMLYKTPFIADNNLGWCHYKKGNLSLAIEHIRAALASNPKFCLGHRNLGQIHQETGNLEKAATSYAAYVRHCPDIADAHYRLAVVLTKRGEVEEARRELTTCAEKAREKEEPVGEECQRLLKLLETQ